MVKLFKKVDGRKTIMKKLVSLFLALICVLSVFSISLTSFAADESANQAKFKIVADKTSDISKDDKITVSVKLKTNYKIYVVGLPVVYDSTKLELLNTSSSSISSFLNFQGVMASNYVTNGNWKSPQELYTKRNSNTSYWSQPSVMSKYKILTATWTADSTKSNTPVILSDESVIVSFQFKAKNAIASLSDNDIFISDDFKKTSSFAGGVWYVGRCAGNHISDASFVAVGQTLTASSNFNNTPEKVEISIDMNYKSSVNLMDYLEGFDASKCSFATSDSGIVSVDGTKATGVKKGTAKVTVTQSSPEKVAEITINVKLAWWQWLIKVLLFGFLWY